MSKKNNYFLLLTIFFFPIAESKDTADFKNISVQADQVILKEEMGELIFINSINIKIDTLVIKGDSALMSFNDEKIEISGEQASIKSPTIDGKADLFIIYPNQSIDMIGNAKLLNNGNLISSNLIKYQITSDG
tara:strand:+ start:1554 stop:1952 length:399 start_codon:yes stop_codon:yes gene_type:complete